MRVTKINSNKLFIILPLLYCELLKIKCRSASLHSELKSGPCLMTPHSINIGESIHSVSQIVQSFVQRLLQSKFII
jgi:hypothetical protein